MADGHLTDLILSSAPFVGSEIIPSDNVAVQSEVDLFWEAPEHSYVSFDTEGSSFHQSSTSSEPLSWADNSHASAYSMSSYGNHSSDEVNRPYNDTIATEVDPANAIYAKNATEEFYHSEQYPASTKVETQAFSDSLLEVSRLPPSLARPEASGKRLPETFSEDPFMGWAAKRSSQIFEDYGWVPISCGDPVSSVELLG